ncbi:tetratricopeptide repeat protein [Nocardiopsis lucentensis]
MGGMAPPPDAHENSAHGTVSGQLVQAKDIHGDVTINVSSVPAAPASDVALDPPRLATAVRGRDDLLTVLGDAMRAGAAVPHVLTGPGGFGKTTVAAALAERARSDGWTVFWIRPGSVTASMLEAAVEVGGSREEAERLRGTRHQAARWVWRHLDGAPRPWLLVIDNADRPEELDPDNRVGDQLGWMRASPGGFVLVTSRIDDPALWAPAEVHRVGELDARSATRALADHAGLPSLPGADVLAERLGGVPLALHLAGRILATHRVLFPDANALLDRLASGIESLDDLAAPFVVGTDADRKLLSGVWELSLRLVAERDAYAAPLLRLLAVLGPEGKDIPLRRLPISELREGPFDGMDEAATARAVNALVVHGLVSVTTHQNETSLRLHPLVSETVRTALTEDDVPLLDEAEHLLEWQRDRDLDMESAALFMITMSRIRLHSQDKRSIGNSALKLIGAIEQVHLQALRTLVSVARTLLRLGSTSEAEEVLIGCVDAGTKSFGAHDATVMSARHFLAESRLYQDRLDDAEEAFRAVHADRARVFGGEHPDTLDSLYQLGLIALRRERWDEATEILGSVREKRARTSDEEDPLALLAAQNMAYVTMRRGDPAAAEPEFRHVHTTRKRDLGPDHHMTADAAYYVALARLEMGDAENALTWFTEVLRVWNAQLSQDHPQVAMVERSIAEAERAVARRPEAP